MAEKKYCNNCGAELNENAKFCTSCGKPIEEPKATHPVLDTTQPEETDSNKKKSNTILGGILSFICIMVFLFGIDNSFFIPQIIDVINGDYVAHPEDLDPGYSYPEVLVNDVTPIPSEFKTKLYTPYILSKFKKGTHKLPTYGIGLVTSEKDSPRTPNAVNYTISPIFNSKVEPTFETTIDKTNSGNLFHKGDYIVFWGYVYPTKGELKDSMNTHIVGYCAFDINVYTQIALEEGLPLPEGYTAPVSSNVTEPVQQPDNTSVQQSTQTPESSTNQDLPDYITGSSTQLGIQNLYNIEYCSTNGGNPSMYIYGNKNGYDSVKFFDFNNLIWEGEIKRFDTSDNGGLVIMVYGIGAFDGEYLEAYWKSVNDPNSCVVENSDNARLNGYYATFDTLQQSQTVMPGSDKGCGYVIEGSDSRYLTKDELMGMSKTELRRGRNEIYARHGRIFKSDDLNDYFNSMDWYYPTVPSDQFNEDVLNQYEKQNLITIKEVEDSK